MKSSWQRIIWREWRHCLDPEYGQQLFELVAYEPAGWPARLSLIGLDMLTGASLGLILGFVLSSSWEILRLFLWAGGLIGGLVGYLAGRNLTWQAWLQRLSANTPTSDWPRFIGTALLLSLMGGFIFGPVFWLGLVGLFWGIGSVLPWLNQGSVRVQPSSVEERRWWFWWPRRPWLAEVEAALRQACEHSPPSCIYWKGLLERLTERRAQELPPETLAQGLINPDWQERFIANHALVTCGNPALLHLQTIPRQETETPLQQTVDWLILNLKQPIGEKEVEVRQ
jgi:hypothetical protein